MSTLLPPDLHAMLFEEIKELVEPRPFVPKARTAVNLDAKEISLLMLSTRTDTDHCDAFFKEWMESGRDVQVPDRRAEFARDLMVAARKDTVAFLNGHLFYTQPVEDIGGMSIAEATSVELVVTIIGNLIMRDLQMAHESEAGPALSSVSFQPEGEPR